MFPCILNASVARADPQVAVTRSHAWPTAIT